MLAQQTRFPSLAYSMQRDASVISPSSIVILFLSICARESGSGCLGAMCARTCVPGMGGPRAGQPMTHIGEVIYGILIGLLVVVIRVWGGLPEGVMYAILLSNAVGPHIDNWIQPRAYGTGIRGPAHE